MSGRIGDAATDATLLTQARDGDAEAIGELWRRHFPGALRLAARLTRQRWDAEEVASEAFAAMLGALRRGSGPTESVRAYLATAVRHEVIQRARSARARDVLHADVAEYEDVARLEPNPVHKSAELHLVRQAFASLPRRWQVVLWQTAVDHESNTHVAQQMDLRPNAVAALAKRARRALRNAYLDAHLKQGDVAPGCRRFVEHFGAYLDGDAKRAGAIEDHIAGCDSCAGRVDELQQVTRKLAAVVLPPAATLDTSAAAGVSSKYRATAARGVFRTGRGRTLMATGSIGVATAIVALFWPSNDAGPPGVIVNRPTPSALGMTANTTSRPGALPAQLSVSVAISDAASATSIRVTATGANLVDSVRLTLVLPANVSLLGFSGDWAQCTENETTVTCFAEAGGRAAWTGDVVTQWDAAAGQLAATVYGQNADGRPAMASVSTPWPKNK